MATRGNVMKVPSDSMVLIADSSITTNKIMDGAITADKLSDDVKSDIDSKLAAVPIAAPGAVGGIKPLTDGSGTVNRSGLVIGEDGTAYISTKANGGISRDGAGQLYITSGGINSSMLANGAVNGGILSDLAVSTLKIEDGAVTGKKISSGAVTLEKLDSGLYKYSLTPKRIGTWIDGTPIWRVAIANKISDFGITVGARGFILYGDMLYRIGAIKNTDNSRVLSHHLYYSNTANTPVYGDFSNNVTETFYGVTFTEDELEPTHRIDGYIEFITPASNIKQGPIEEEIPDEEVPL